MAKVVMRTARTAEQDAAKAAEALVSQLGGFKPVFVTVFASRDRDHEALNRELRQRLPAGTRLLGASTAGEIDNEGIHRRTVVLSAFGGDLEIGIGLGEGLTVDAMSAGLRACEQACADLGTRPEDLDTRRHVGIVIDDGFRYKKEELLLGVLDRNQGLVLVGGGASDHEQDPAKQSALVHVDDQVATDAALVAIIRTDVPWRVLRSHWYESTNQVLKITKIDETRIRALEIDGKPAAERYAELLGCTVDDLDYSKPSGFAFRPTALRVGREYFIRAPWKTFPDGSILFTNLLEEGSEYEVMKRGDMVQHNVRFFQEELPRRIPSPRAAILFNCSGRDWIAQANGIERSISDSFKVAPPCVGMNAFFETYCGFSINNTLTTLVFGGSE